MPDPSALEISGLRYRAGAFNLTIDRLTLSKGQYLCVVGPTGSGKTVLLELIAGIRSCEAGLIAMHGIDVSMTAPERRSIGYSYQDSLLFPFLDVEENILFGAHARSRMLSAAIRERCAYLMDEMGIQHLRHRNPRFLSGGERQRVSLARALLLKPRLLLLDEPMSAVDAPRRRHLRSLLGIIHRTESLAIVHVTHDQREVDDLATHMAVLHDGKLIQQGAIEELQDFNISNYSAAYGTIDLPDAL